MCDRSHASRNSSISVRPDSDRLILTHWRDCTLTAHSYYMSNKLWKARVGVLEYESSKWLEAKQTRKVHGNLVEVMPSLPCYYLGKLNEDWLTERNLAFSVSIWFYKLYPT